MKVIFVVIMCLMLKVARYLNSYLLIVSIDFYLGSSVLSKILFNNNWLIWKTLCLGFVYVTFVSLEFY